jgi:hypothetical protein
VTEVYAVTSLTNSWTETSVICVYSEKEKAIDKVKEKIADRGNWSKDHWEEDSTGDWETEFRNLEIETTYTVTKMKLL